jgi:PAS domain S-box-containing protein
MHKENSTLSHKESRSEMGRAKALAILDHVPAFVYLKASDFSIDYANRPFRALFGDPEGKTCYQALRGSSKPCISCPELSVWRTGDPKTWEWNGPDARTYEIHSCPYVGPNGRELVLNMGVDMTQRKEIEAALLLSEQKFRNLVESTSDWILEIDDQGTIIYASPQIKDMLGYVPEEILGRKPLELCPRDEARRLASFVKQLLKTPQAFRGVEGINVHKDGHLVQLEAGGAPVWGLDGSFSGYLCVYHDVTERKKTEAALSATLAHLDGLINATPDIVSFRDLDDRYVIVNKAYEEFLGRSKEEIVGRTFWELLPPEIAEGVEKVDEKVLERREIVRAQQIMVKNEETTFLDRIRFPIFDELGQLIGLGGIARDISDWKQAELALREARDELEKRVVERTREINQINESLRREIAEREQAEMALRHSEELFRAIFDSAQDLIFIKDLSRRYVKVNPAVERVLGLPASEIVGLKADAFVDRQSSEAMAEYESRILAGETVEEERTMTVKGTTFVFHSIAVPLKDTDGAITGICSISRDTTERKMAGAIPQVGARGYQSEPMRATLKAIGHAAASDVIVLLQGESGSGKDYAARSIHDLSNRAGGPFFSINCAALPHELAESELFGHEAGAFTGALKRKRGLLELAEGGTLLLNEIGELSLPLQAKLLSFLDARSFLRVGGEKSITVNARLMAATHRDLEAETDEGRFLRPLYYRLSVFSIHIPPLRERMEDIPSIAEELMEGLAREMQLSAIPVIHSADMRDLQRYHWPGNIRELRNVLERALIVSGTGPFRLSLPAPEQATEHWSYKVRFVPGQTLRDVTDEVTQGLCMEALRRCQGSKTEAARMLGISRDSMYRHMKRFGLSSENRTQG